MERGDFMARSNSSLAALLVAAALAIPLQAVASAIHIESGSIKDGSLETRNNPIRIGDDVSVDGNIGSRNGSITLGERVSAGNVTTRNGSIGIGSGCQVERVSTRNGSIRIGSDCQAGGLDSRNGQISVASGSRIERVVSRNGAIVLGDQVTVDGTARTRNGGVQVGANTEVGGNVVTRNGRIALAPGSQVSGKVATRNGNIHLDGALIGQDLETMSGEVMLRNVSQVDGDLVIDLEEATASQRGFLWFGRSANFPDVGSVHILEGSQLGGDLVIQLPADYDGKLPEVHIDAASSVLGNVRVDHRVKLSIDGTVAGVIERIE
jgi:hypothetical protein